MTNPRRDTGVEDCISNYLESQGAELLYAYRDIKNVDFEIYKIFPHQLAPMMREGAINGFLYGNYIVVTWEGDNSIFSQVLDTMKEAYSELMHNVRVHLRLEHMYRGAEYPRGTVYINDPKLLTRELWKLSKRVLPHVLPIFVMCNSLTLLSGRIF